MSNYSIFTDFKASITNTKFLSLIPQLARVNIFKFLHDEKDFIKKLDRD